jgi:hypothetical protein
MVEVICKHNNKRATKKEIDFIVWVAKLYIEGEVKNLQYLTVSDWKYLVVMWKGRYHKIAPTAGRLTP